jgi:hypothetical protein
MIGATIETGITGAIAIPAMIIIARTTAGKATHGETIAATHSASITGIGITGNNGRPA